jgi:hypothetical protein
VSSDVAQRRREPTVVILVAALIVLAIALRLWRLGDWNFQATEMFTLRDSFRPQFDNTRPLGYLLNYYLVRPFLPLDEFGLRLLPAVFGVLTVPAFFLVSQRLTGTRAALLGTLLLTLSPLHVMYSQLARYWSLVFLLSVIYPYAIYLGIRERSRRAMVIGLVSAVLAVLAHPASALLFGGLGVWFLVMYVRPRDVAELWKQKSVRWVTMVAVLLAVVMAIRLIPILQGWISEHDKNPGSGQFLLRPPSALWVKQVVYLLAYLDGVTVPMALTGAVGIYMLWRRDRSLGLLLACLAMFPIIFLTLILVRTPVSTYYLLPTVSVFFIGAGVFLDRLFEVDWKLRPQWLVPVTATIIVIAAGLPTLVSDSRNGRRYDFRAAAHWLEEEGSPGDIIYSDQPMVLAHYMKGRKVERLRYDIGPLAESVRVLRQSGPGEALWIVVPSLSHALRTNLKQGGLIGWIYDNCRLVNTVGRGRIDFRQQYLQVYRCPPTVTPQ